MGNTGGVNMGIIKKIFSCLFFLSTAVLFQNCSAQKFSAVDPLQKAQTLDSHAGLGEFDDQGNSLNDHSDNGSENRSTSDNGTNNGQQNDSGNNNYGLVTTHNQPTKNPMSQSVVPADIKLTVIRLCRGADRGGSLKTSQSVTIKLYNESNNNLICSVSGSNVLENIVSNKIINLQSCNVSNLSRVKIVATNEKNEPLLRSGEDYKNININQLDTIELVLDKSVDKSKQDARCDRYTNSPLVVDMRTQEELSTTFTLSAPIDGDYFDILGKNSNPEPYTKKLISKIEDPRIMPIVLFDKSKEFGIDQLFGDNTLGPDGQFSENGFTALAKYDGLHLRSNKVIDADGVIDANDEIYNKLSLWYDRNMDNKVQVSELISLRAAGITLIDLDYDKDHYSQDQYGNEIKYKSVVKTRKGNLRPVFDVWYLVDETIQ